ncbi:MAG: hypothetical protein AAF297_09230 [Planctomycetota bacterium]
MAAKVPQPRRGSGDELGERVRPLTVFVTADERAAVVKRLRRVHRDRRVALLRALGVSKGE